MKKNLLALMFVIAFICVGVSVASAKNSSSPGSSAAVSKRLAAVAKARAFKGRCMTMVCEYELQELQLNNMLYVNNCEAGGYQAGCDPYGELMLLQSASDWEECMYWSGGFNVQNIDKNIDRNKKQKSYTTE